MSRSARTVAVLALVPALALAAPQDEAPDPRGELLLAAVAERADLVVHTPDLRGLLDAAEADGLGSSKAWRDTFSAQLTAWGERTGFPAELAAGGLALLRAADGEAVIASMPLPGIGGPPRATLLGFRTSRTEAQLRRSIDDVIRAGLALEYPGEPRIEEIQGRRVIAVDGIDQRLYIAVQDGLVAVSDHPLALGLLFRGLESAGPVVPHGPRLLSVRHGRGTSAWTGWTYGDRESVSWKPAATEALRAPVPAGCEMIAAVALLRPDDVPLFPVPAPDWTAELPTLAGSPVLVAMPRRGGMLVAGPVVPGATSPGIDSVPEGQAALGPALWAVVRGRDDVLVESSAASATPPVVAGGASRLGWLRAWASGRVPSVLPDIAPARFLGPLASAGEATGDFVVWDGTDQPGELRGPRSHGPATMLALRTLYDIATKTRPGERALRRAPRAPLPPKAGGSPLPDPTIPRDAPPEPSGEEK